MSRAFVTKTSFTAGELDPLLRGRLDLKAQEDGAARLRNVVVHPTGGVSRRPGLRLIARRARRAAPAAVRRARRRRARGVRRLPARRPQHGAVIHSFTDTLWGAGGDRRSQHRALGRPAADLPSRRAAQGAGPQRRVGLAAARLGLRAVAGRRRPAAQPVPVRPLRPARDRAPGQRRHRAPKSPPAPSSRSSPASPCSRPTTSTP